MICKNCQPPQKCRWYYPPRSLRYSYTPPPCCTDSSEDRWEDISINLILSLCLAPAWHCSGTESCIQYERTSDSAQESLNDSRPSRSTPHTQQCPQGNCYLGDWRECRLPHLAHHLTLPVAQDSGPGQRGAVVPALVHLGVRGVKNSRIFWSWSYLVTGGGLTPHQARDQYEEHHGKA